MGQPGQICGLQQQGIVKGVAELISSGSCNRRAHRHSHEIKFQICAGCFCAEGIALISLARPWTRLSSKYKYFLPHGAKTGKLC